MALVATTLTGAVASGDTQVVLASSTGVAKGSALLVNSELMRVTDDSQAPQYAVLRGQGGTVAQSQGINSFVIAGPGTDFEVRQPFASVRRWREITVGVAGAIPVPTETDTLVNLNTGTAGAMTLASPGYNIEGLRMIITARSAHAYTVDNTAFIGIADGNNLATYGGAIGDSMTLLAQGGSWVVTEVSNVLFS